MTGLTSALRKSSFTKRLLEINHLCDKFDGWVLRPGMFFQSPDLWWGRGARRARPHEGLDLLYYRDRGGNEHALDKKTLVPPIYAGEVIKIQDDFIGKSLYMKHEIHDDEGNQLLTIYGHTQPYKYLEAEVKFQEGDILGTIAAGKKKPTVPAHLHITVALIPRNLPPACLNWETIGSARLVSLFDPLPIIAPVR